MSSDKNYRHFERPCLHHRGQAVEDLLDPRTIHQSTLQHPPPPPKKKKNHAAQEL
jgi:hypothetical protein